MSSLVRVVARLERRLAQRLETVWAADGLTADQWRVLELLSDGTGRPMSAIAAEIVVPGATLTKLVDRLVDASVVYRRMDGADRRRILVQLADHGQEVYDRLRPEVERVEAQFVDSVGERTASALILLGRAGDAAPGELPVEQIR